MVHGLMFFPENAIPDEIGETAARLLFQDLVFRNIHEDIKEGRKIILARQPTSRGVIFNTVGKPGRESMPPPGESAKKQAAALPWRSIR